MFNYHKPPPLPTNEEIYEKGKTVGLFDIDIVPVDDGVKIYTKWGGFRKSDFKKFPNHPILETLKKIYSTLEKQLSRIHIIDYSKGCEDSFTVTKIKNSNKYKGPSYKYPNKMLKDILNYLKSMN